MFERLQPGGKRIFQHGHINILLAREIIKQVWLRHACLLGDLVDRRTSKAISGKNLQRCIEDKPAIYTLNARRAFRLVVRHFLVFNRVGP